MQFIIHKLDCVFYIISARKCENCSFTVRCCL